MKFNAFIKAMPKAWLPPKFLSAITPDLFRLSAATKKQIIMGIKLTTLMIIIALVQVSAKGFSQKITLNEDNASLEKVLQLIKKQSGYVFFYASKDVKVKVNVHIASASIEDALKACFMNIPLTYKVADKTVFLQQREPSAIDRLKNFFAVPVDAHGRVADAAGTPLAGATVRVKANKTGVITDGNGEFTIRNIQEGTILEISYISYITQEITVTRENAGSMQVVLNVQSHSLQEIAINTGFQMVSKEKMTGATASVTSADLEKRYTPNILNNLEGRIPGLVTYRGVTSIRGVSTINASKNPLIVLDGLPIEGSIADINPYDVADITVLKDAAAAAIYGARAANGVIVIATKKAKGKGTMIEFSSDVTITDKPNIDFNLLSPAQQVDIESGVYKYVFANSGGLYANSAAAVSATATSITNGSPITPMQYAYYQFAKGTISQSQLDSRIAGFKQNDFRKQFKDNALLNTILQQYNFAIRTAGDKFQSSLVLNYKNDNTGIINAYNRQLNIFYKGSYQFSKWLEANYGINGVLGYARASSSNFATSALNISPYQQLLDANGNRVYYTTADYNSYNTTASSQPVSSLLVNHLDELGRDSKNTTQQNTRYYVNLNAKLIPGLTLSPQFQYENNTLNSSAYSEADSYVMRYLQSIYTSLLPATGGKLATVNTKGDYWTARGQAEYKHSFGKHAIDVIGGTEFRQTRLKGTGGLLLGYDDQLQSQSTTAVSFPALNAYKTTTAFKPGFSTASAYNTYISGAIAVIPETVHRFNSNYANATYTYDNRYNVFGSYRIDYADVFGLDEKFRGKPLWSTGIGWNLHNESFLSAVNWISFLKLRATYGVTGNIVQAVSSFLTANSTLFNPVTNQPLSVVTNAANPELRWEKTATTNVGLDFSLLTGRLNGSVDWYRKKGRDLLVTQRLDPSEGFTSQIINNGGLLNNGLELNLQYDWFKTVKRSGLGWSSTVVLSKNKNKITYIDEVTTTPLALAQGGYKVGYPVNSLFSYQYKGLNSVGQPQWLKGDGGLSTIALTSNDMNAMAYSGSTDPQININLNNELHYKGFSLNILAVYYGGQYLRALVPQVVSGVSYGSLPAYLSNSWSPTNTNTIVPGFGQYTPGTYAGTQAAPPLQLNYSDTFVRAGDFIKIRSAVLGYQLPQRITETLASKSIRLHFQLNNPKALWTKNDVGVDPETGGARIPASYVFGINLNY
jgi:TonB-linked SusC/RagA family outer membrane protein